jgi:hypothetical protein
MLHLVHLIRRHHPERADAIITRLVLLSSAGVALGGGLLLLGR